MSTQPLPSARMGPASTILTRSVDPTFGLHAAPYLSYHAATAYLNHLELQQPVQALTAMGFPFDPSQAMLHNSPHIGNAIFQAMPAALQHLVLFIDHVGASLLHVLTDISALALPLSLVMIIGRLANWLLNCGDVADSVKTIIRTNKFLADLPTETTEIKEYCRRAVLNQHDVPSNAVPLTLPAHNDGMQRQAHNLALLRGTNDALLTLYSNQLLQMQRGLDNRNEISVPQNCPTEFLGLLHDFAPEYSYRQYTFNRPHAACALARRISVSLCYERYAQQSVNVVAVAASDAQVAACPNLIHNHAPELSGRDAYRYREAYSPAQRTFAALFNCKHTLQNCPTSFPDTRLFLPLSAQDIHIGAVIQSMIANRQRTADVILHLPVPFLDPRITSWVDGDLEVRFERRDGMIAMYHLAGSAAGYYNSEDTVMSWLLPPPLVAGYNVLVEEERHIGSLYTLKLMVHPGAQEAYPKAYTTCKERFYLLPVLKPHWMFNADEDRHYAVPATRFENVVKYAQISGANKNSFELIANKVRGQEAEIKVANQVVLPRWVLNLDQFNSTVVHAIVCASMHNRANEVTAGEGMCYLQEWFNAYHGSFAMRYARYVIDTFSLRAARGHRTMFAGRGSTRFMDGFFGMFYRDGKFDNPYELHGNFRISVETRIPHVLVAPGEAWDLSGATNPHGHLPPSCRAFEKPDPLPASEWFLREFRWYDEEAFNSSLRRSWTWAEGSWDESMKGDWHNYDPFNLYPEERDSDGEGDDSAEDESSAGRGDGRGDIPVEEPAESAQGNDAVAESAVGDTFSDLYDDAGEESTSAPVDFATLSDESELTPDLQLCAVNCAVYQVLVPDDVSTLRTDAQIDFAAPLSFANAPDSSPSHLEFTRRFASDAELDAAITHKETIPAPDRGLLEVLRRAVERAERNPVGFELNFDPAAFLRDEGYRAAQETQDLYDNDSDGGLAEVIERMAIFAGRYKGRKASAPAVILDGIPASAKSSAIRQLISGGKALVVTPTGELRRDWQRLVDRRDVQVTTMHKVPSATAAEWLIIDEANRFDDRLIQVWCLIAAGMRITRVVCLGDTFQSQRRSAHSATLGEGALRGFKVVLYNSFDMPVDALVAFRAINHLHGDMYRTKSRIIRSIAVLDRDPIPEEFARFDLHTRARVSAAEVRGPDGSAMPSVTQAQGRRAVKHYHTSGLLPRQARWLAQMQPVQSVLVSRHSKTLIIDNPIRLVQQGMPHVTFEQRVVIDGNSQSRKAESRAFIPGYLDYLPKTTVNPKEIHSAAMPLRATYTTEERLYPYNPIPDFEMQRDRQPIRVYPVRHLIGELIQEKARFGSRREYKEDLDFFAEQAHGLLSCGELGWGDEPRMRSHLEGADRLGDIQMSRDRYNDLRNLCLRQLNEPKGTQVTMQDWTDAVIMHRRYIQAYVADEYVSTMFGPTTHDYMVSRSQHFLDAWNDPFGFIAGSLRRHAFLKTQVKVKPGLNGQETHGQQIIAQEPELTNEFFDLCRLAAKGFRETDRPDFITDTGYADADLENLMQHNGMAARIEGGARNLQIDLSRQDSTHRPAHVLAFALYLLGLGAEEERVMLYVALRATAFVKSMAPDLYKAIIKWNLASGDGFTLIANCHMMKCSLAVKYDGLRRCAAIQKGDDFLASDEGYTLGGVPHVYNRLRVKMKIDEELPAYHAGRYLYKGRLLADPVRAFFRHYSKTYSPDVSIAELHQSFCDRTVDYSAEEQRYLETVVPVHYEDISPEQARVIVQGVLSLRSYKFFASTYKHQTHPTLGLYSPSTDCAFLVARFLAPQLAHRTLKTFRFHTDQDDLVALFRKYGIPAMRAEHPVAVPRDFLGAVVLPSHCYAKVAPAPHY